MKWSQFRQYDIFQMFNRWQFIKTSFGNVKLDAFSQWCIVHEFRNEAS